MRRLLALLLSAAPFVAAAVAALSARHDLRMLWMALAATLVARLALLAAPRRWGAGGAVGAALAAASAAAVVGMLLGARAAFGVGAVAAVLACCAAAGAAIGGRPRAAV
jgi:hypothetical protein